MPFNTLRHKKPIDDSPNPFLLECLDVLTPRHGAVVLDLPCGYGRHSRFLSEYGLRVISGDLDYECLFEGLRLGAINNPVALDTNKSLPFKESIFDIILVTEYSQMGLVGSLNPYLKDKGHIIYETFGGRGGNWLSLPKYSSFNEETSTGFDPLILRTKIVGPKDEGRVTVRYLGRKSP